MRKVSIIHQHMESGSVDSLKAGQFDIVIGKQMADSLGVKQGDMVTLVLPEASPSPCRRDSAF